jgi:hypothetical protein
MEKAPAMPSELDLIFVIGFETRHSVAEWSNYQPGPEDEFVIYPNGKRLHPRSGREFINPQYQGLGAIVSNEELDDMRRQIREGQWPLGERAS